MTDDEIIAQAVPALRRRIQANPQFAGMLGITMAQMLGAPMTFGDMGELLLAAILRGLEKADAQPQ